MRWRQLWTLRTTWTHGGVGHRIWQGLEKLCDADPMHVSGLDFGKGWKTGKARASVTHKGTVNAATARARQERQRQRNGKKGKSEDCGKSAGKGKDYTDSIYFSGECGWCGILGHRRKDCRKRTNYIAGYKKDNSASGTSAEASADDKMEVGALSYDCDGDVGWVFGVDFCDDVEYDEGDWYLEWATHGDDYEFEEEIEFEDQYEFDERIEFVRKNGFVEKNDFVDKYGFVDKNEFV